MRTSLTRALAGTAIAATTMLTAAGVASASTPAKAPTSLSIVASATAITVGSPVKIGGALMSGKSPLAKKIVLLDRLIGKNWVPVAAELTNTAGQVAFVRRPDVTVHFKLVYLGNARFAAAHSGVLTVTVNRAPTMLSIVSTPGAVKRGQADTITGVLSAGKTPLAGRRVWLERYSAAAKKWLVLAGEPAGKFGKVVFLVKPAVTANYMLAFFGTVNYAPTHSAVVTVSVK